MEDHVKAIGIADTHSLVQTDSKWEQRKGQDTDTYWYDEVDSAGAVVAKYVAYDSTGVYPPHGRSITFEKLA